MFGKLSREGVVLVSMRTGQDIRFATVDWRRFTQRLLVKGGCSCLDLHSPDVRRATIGKC